MLGRKRGCKSCGHSYAHTPNDEMVARRTLYPRVGNHVAIVCNACKRIDFVQLPT